MASNVTEFAKRVKSILWRQESGTDKKSYESWKAKVASLESPDGLNYSKNEAIVQASKDYPCLFRLFREYDVSKFDPDPNSHPTIQYFSKTPGTDFVSVKIECEGIEQSYRDSLRWAIDAAGSYLRTGQQPVTCPCDAAYYLYKQAIEEPKDFLAKVGQIESKGESDPNKNDRRSSQRSISEIDSMLAELQIEEETNATNS